jgi:ribosome-binding factor A
VIAGARIRDAAAAHPAREKITPPMARSAQRTPSQRQLRVGEEIRHALAWILERDELRDPALQGHPVTVTEVLMSPDLRHARVFVMPLGGGDIAAMVAALGRASGFLRRRVGEAVRLKYLPALVFSEDESFAQADAIERLLRAPEVRRDLASGQSAEDGSADQAGGGEAGGDGNGSRAGGDETKDPARGRGGSGQSGG